MLEIAQGIGRLRQLVDDVEADRLADAGRLAVARRRTTGRGQGRRVLSGLFFIAGHNVVALRNHAVRVLLTGLAVIALGRRAVEHLLAARSEEHTSELQSQSNLVCRLLLEKKKKKKKNKNIQIKNRYTNITIINFFQH